MMASAALPTRRDEAWRYAPADLLAGLSGLAPPAQISVAPGETEIRTEAVDVTPDGAFLHRPISAAVGVGGRLELFWLITPGVRYQRIELEVTLAEGAHFELGAVILAGGEATAEIITTVRHEGVAASSRQIVRAIAAGAGTANFIGRIEVAKGAQQTDAEQGIKGLLLNRGAAINAKPELEIFADDVKCAHGCAIGALDETAAFYMAARGLPPEEARRLLMAAFLADSFTALADDEARDDITNRAIAALEQLA